ncbi:hypothetical protein SADUNF_Sadunf02G0077200 [Salix dunnii]|uniref:F-box domain-containing protein n=1 Tax=Salix dunnii TaxID=1413687 RepID=A0A835N6W7_9ROSI|nr:hypothetical protein SADUNF_Sadunf02G0077200 [Salix dunnii]
MLVFFTLVRSAKGFLMGGVLSLARTSEYNEVLNNGSCKRQKTTSTFYDEESPRLIPFLPDELSIQILARIPRCCYFNLRLVSRKWKDTFESAELFKVRKDFGSTEEWLYVLIKDGADKLSWHALDPLSRNWQRLPPMPNVVCADESKRGLSGFWLWNVVGPGIKIAEVIRSWLGQKDTLDQMPFGGCSIGAVDGCLYVLGGFFRATTVKCVWRFNPISNEWSKMTSMSTGRAYCKTSILNNKLYVVGGVSQGQGRLTPLQSAEVFDPSTGTWSDIPSMPFSRAQLVPTAYLSDMLKPIATGMTSYMGRLFVPQSLYSWPFIVDVGGEMYDPETNSWAEMPTGMGEGWPARQAGTKLSVVVDGELYAFDPCTSADSGKIKVYDQKEDTWKVVIGKVPVADFTESESPYLLTGLHGKIHVLTKDANRNIAVMQADVQDNLGSPLNSTSVSAESLHEHSDSSETVVWKVIAGKRFGSAELVSGCLRTKVTRAANFLLWRVGHVKFKARGNHYRGWVLVRDSSMATSALIEVRFRLPDGNDIGPNKYNEAANVATLKEHVIEQWPKDKENGPKTIKDVKLIYAGHVLENHRTLAESRLPVGDRLAGVVTIHVVLRPPGTQINNEKAVKEAFKDGYEEWSPRNSGLSTGLSLMPNILESHHELMSLTFNLCKLKA